MKESIKDKLKKNRFIYKVGHGFNLIINKLKGSIQGIDNKINDYSLVSQINYDIIGNGNVIVIDEACRILSLKVFIRGNNNKVYIGKKCIIKAGLVWIEDNGCELYIGNDTTIEDAHFGITEPNSKIQIGMDCMLSSGIKLLTGDSHSIIDLATSQRINYAENIKIDDHVWIGTDVIILKGVTIGKDTVIGSRSIVTRAYGSNLVIAGSPAKVVKENVTWDRKRIYL